MKISGTGSCARCGACCGLSAASGWACSASRSRAGLTIFGSLRRCCWCRNCCARAAAFAPTIRRRWRRAKEVLKSGVEFASDAYEAATGADALLILTEWEEFAALDLERLRTLVKYPIVLDGRNLYDPAVMVEHGFSYYSVGRPAALTEELTAGRCPKKRSAPEIMNTLAHEHASREHTTRAGDGRSGLSGIAFVRWAAGRGLSRWSRRTIC